MPTLDRLIEEQELHRLEVFLEGTEQSWRCLIGTPDFVEWLDGGLIDLVTNVVGGEITPLEQVDALFHDFVIGDPLKFERRFKKLKPLDRHVWELKTPDVRIFGWFCAKDHFICCFGDCADQIKLMNSYGKYVAQTLYFRNNIQLDDPKCLESEEYDVVLSNKN